MKVLERSQVSIKVEKGSTTILWLAHLIKKRAIGVGPYIGW